MSPLSRHALASVLAASLLGALPPAARAQASPDPYADETYQDQRAPYPDEPGEDGNSSSQDRYDYPDAQSDPDGYDDRVEEDRYRPDRGDGAAGNPTAPDAAPPYPAQGYDRRYPSAGDSMEEPRPYADAQPERLIDRTGKGEVRFDGGRCVVRYRDWEMRSATPGCSDEQIRQADDEVSYGREGGENASPAYNGGYYQPPRAFVGTNGAGRVIVSEDCTAFYDRTGGRETETDACTRAELRAADQTMARYRREHGWY